ncbi:hypothetical protein B0H13DRAFT_2652005 [Mycena leptocephala]|nr:hypothetical protein B0H13DRAFT_2652005 [Mycena leptocephala]
MSERRCVFVCFFALVEALSPPPPCPVAPRVPCASKHLRTPPSPSIPVPARSASFLLSLSLALYLPISNPHFVPSQGKVGSQALVKALERPWHDFTKELNALATNLTTEALLSFFQLDLTLDYTALDGSPDHPSSYHDTHDYTYRYYACHNQKNGAIDSPPVLVPRMGFLFWCELYAATASPETPLAGVDRRIFGSVTVAPVNNCIMLWHVSCAASHLSTPSDALTPLVAEFPCGLTCRRGVYRLGPTKPSNYNADANNIGAQRSLLLYVDGCILD